MFRNGPGGPVTKCVARSAVCVYTYIYIYIYIIDIYIYIHVYIYISIYIYIYIYICYSGHGGPRLQKLVFVKLRLLGGMCDAVVQRNQTNKLNNKLLSIMITNQNNNIKTHENVRRGPPPREHGHLDGEHGMCDAVVQRKGILPHKWLI